MFFLNHKSIIYSLNKIQNPKYMIYNNFNQYKNKFKRVCRENYWHFFYHIFGL